MSSVNRPQQAQQAQQVAGGAPMTPQCVMVPAGMADRIAKLVGQGAFPAGVTAERVSIPTSLDQIVRQYPDCCNQDVFNESRRALMAEREVLDPAVFAQRLSVLIANGRVPRLILALQSNNDPELERCVRAVRNN